MQLHWLSAAAAAACTDLRSPLLLCKMHGMSCCCCGMLTHACWCADDIKAGLTAHFVKSYDQILKLALLPDQGTS